MLLSHSRQTTAVPPKEASQKKKQDTQPLPGAPQSSKEDEEEEDGQIPHRLDNTNVDFTSLFTDTEAYLKRRIDALRSKLVPLTLAESMMSMASDQALTPEELDQELVKTLRWFDENGYQRSAHQMILHDLFRCACTKLIYKDKFAAKVEQIMADNGWSDISQEVFAETPRRFGKTIGVAQFATAIAMTLPKIRICVYSTGQITATAMLTNIRKFFVEMGTTNKFRIVTDNQSEFKFSPISDPTDERTIRSYTSNEMMSTPTHRTASTCTSTTLKWQYAKSHDMACSMPKQKGEHEQGVTISDKETTRVSQHFFSLALILTPLMGNPIPCVALHDECTGKHFAPVVCST